MSEQNPGSFIEFRSAKETEITDQEALTLYTQALKTYKEQLMHAPSAQEAPDRITPSQHLLIG